MAGFERKDVLGMLNDGGTHRKQFASNNGVQRNKSSPTFSVPFDNGLVQHFRDGTGQRLTYNSEHDQHYCFLRNDDGIKQAEEWAEAQRSRVFVRNLLASTVALDFNFVDNKSGEKTKCGTWEQAAKHDQLQTAIGKLVDLACDTIDDISYLNDCRVVCAVPAAKEKGFDLPFELAAQIATRTGKENLTTQMSLSNKTQSAKNSPLSEKWDAWAAATLEIGPSGFDGADVILIDDKYQSGLTMHFVASKLLEQGAKSVHGLAMVKTLRDTDNFDVVDP